MHKWSIRSAVLACLLLAGCATDPSSETLARVGYGSPLTTDYQAAIKDWFKYRLKDPYTAEYEFSQPKPGYAHTPPIEGSRLLVGYEELVRVNGKNSFGGYIGFQPYLFIFRDNRIVYVFGPDMAETQKRLGS